MSKLDQTCILQSLLANGHLTFSLIHQISE